MKTFRVYYAYPNDVNEYAARIQANNADEADRTFRNSLADDELWDCTVTHIVEVTQ